ncbi:MAG: hypothetical protein DRR16_19245 [Candidatus Parabeggiatoa sp. nov. 3]|nr:MAG: hypothetical protein DRR00_22345 [Gammaproteobacteria bacterium]RKZ60781.1 MAG: hypothetical protein DRQ99_21530 [Gammaproteobacteria bacterium]RKZ82638.1 MAG: hypothetical protein DRR16_19245 [Gammaproteobacteria bacterium]
MRKKLDFTLKLSEAILKREPSVREAKCGTDFHAKVLRAKLYLASRTEGSLKKFRFAKLLK